MNIIHISRKKKEKYNHCTFNKHLQTMNKIIFEDDKFIILIDTLGG
jgi:hypothetical protein